MSTDWPLTYDNYLGRLRRGFGWYEPAEVKAGAYFVLSLVLAFVYASPILKSFRASPIICFILLVVWRIGLKLLSEGRACESLAKTDLSGKVVVVTGGANGLGYETTKELWLRGATVIIACRDTAKGQSAIDKICNEATAVEAAKKRAGAPASGGAAAAVDPGLVPTIEESVSLFAGADAERRARLKIIPLDCNSLQSVREFVTAFRATGLPLHVLINNAGINAFAAGHQLTADGFEQTSGVNHLSHFLLTALLEPELKANRARIVNVSSGGGLRVPNSTSVDDILSGCSKHDYSAIKAYTRSKVAQMMFTTELQRRWGDSGVQAFSCHPGIINSGIWVGNTPKWAQPLIAAIAGLVWKSLKAGAQTQLYCAVDRKAVPGAFHIDCATFPVRTIALDEAKCRELWEKSAKLVAL